jgi:hypothetical protein
VKGHHRRDGFGKAALARTAREEAKSPLRTAGRLVRRGGNGLDCWETFGLDHCGSLD